MFEEGATTWIIKHVEWIEWKGKPADYTCGHLLTVYFKVDFDSINSTYEAMHIDRRQEPALHWCKMSILNYLNLFVYDDHVQPFPTEQDLLKQMYGFIELSRFLSKTTTET